MPNRLSESTSPYLLQHANNPVDWYPWGEEALQKARDEDKPIFLSVGYSACHWCHVMERESFENDKVAEIMNSQFVNIKVDREERPDVDKIYMQSVLLVSGQGGWPMSVWLTPDLKPFYGGTYFPPTPRPGLPSFAQLLLSLAHSWKNKREEIEASANELNDALHQMSDVGFQRPEGEDSWLDSCVQGCELSYDDEHGGFGRAPKFPQAMTLRFLLLRAIRENDSELLEMVEHAAEKMARGGLYDQLGGGFHRYCVDADWTVPHFEKMLYDNALLCEFYAELYGHTGKALYRWIVETLVEWLQREMTLEGGGFASSQDADSEGVEGKFFVWTPSQLARCLDENEREVFSAFFQVTREGNFEHGQTVLTQRQTVSKAAKEMGWDFDFAVKVLESAREKAFAQREKRVRPGRDDKALAAWNGLMLSGLCKAARHLGSKTAYDLAVANGSFLKEQFCEGEVLPRVAMQGRRQGKALAVDLASMARGFFDLYELTLEDGWFTLGCDLFSRLRDRFWDEERGLTALTEAEPADLLLRPYDFEDNAVPSGHSLMLECARRHHRYTGKESSKKILERGLEKVSGIALKAPTGFGVALQAAQISQSPPRDLVLACEPSQGREILAGLESHFAGDITVARAQTPALSEALAAEKETGKAYYCADYTCLAPVSTAEELKEQLDSATR